MKSVVLLAAVLILAGCTNGDTINNQRFSGTLELTEHVLGAKVPGRIATLNVKEGDYVKSAQVLGTVDRYEQALKDYNRLNELFKTGGATQQQVEYAKLAVDDQQVVSPIDGIVLVKTVELGETVVAGAGLIVVGDTANPWVRIFVPEGILNQISMGQKAHIYFDGLKNSVDGHVITIASKSEFTPRNVQTTEERVTQAFAVKVALDKPNTSVHPGVAADVTFK